MHMELFIYNAGIEFLYVIYVGVNVETVNNFSHFLFKM
jgi:hypothetical protein